MDQNLRLESLYRLIGNTPLLAIRCRYNDRFVIIYAKSESLNFTGSIKDRMALHILQQAYHKREVKAGDTIIETTSGNTGIAFAALGRALGHPVQIYMPDWMSRERVLLIQSLGASIVPVSAAEGGFLGAIKLAEEYTQEHENCFLPCQFDNHANVQAHYLSTAPEICAQLKSISLRPTAFVAGVGTGGTVMGVSKYFKEQYGSAATVHPLEPANSPTLKTGHKVGKHRIQGISDEFIPSIVDLESLDEIVDVNDGDAIQMAQKLSSELGLGVGISSGANFLGALQIAEEQGRDAVVATVFADCNKKYLSTDLCRQEPTGEKYISPNVELIDFQVVGALPSKSSFGFPIHGDGIELDSSRI